MDPLNYGWKEKNGYYTPDWFFGPALPDYLFHEGKREEDHQSDVATVFENDEDSNSASGYNPQLLLTSHSFCTFAQSSF